MSTAQNVTRLVCAVCCAQSPEYYEEDGYPPQELIETWTPIAYRGDQEFSPVCPKHKVVRGSDGEMELVE